VRRRGDRSPTQHTSVSDPICNRSISDPVIAVQVLLLLVDPP